MGHLGIMEAHICKTGDIATTKMTAKVSKGAKIRNRYNQAPHLTQDTNGKVTNSHLDTTNESQEVSPFPAGDHIAHITDAHKDLEKVLRIFGRRKS